MQSMPKDSSRAADYEVQTRGPKDPRAEVFNRAVDYGVRTQGVKDARVELSNRAVDYGVQTQGPMDPSVKFPAARRPVRHSEDSE